MIPKDLQDSLCIYLGNLLYELEHEYYWIERARLTEKINAVYVLLEIEKQETTPMEQIMKQFK